LPQHQNDAGRTNFCWLEGDRKTIGQSRKSMMSCRTTIEIAPDSQKTPVGDKPPPFDGQTNLIEIKIQKKRKDPIAKKRSTEIQPEPRVQVQIEQASERVARTTQGRACGHTKETSAFRSKKIFTFQVCVSAGGRGRPSSSQASAFRNVQSRTAIEIANFHSLCNVNAVFVLMYEAL
jgi:hypothetical protein